MELDDIRKHWDSLAKKHGLDLKSTTKTPTIKQLEIDALSRVIRNYLAESSSRSVLEVGCGNGHNIFGLARLFPHFSYLGLDYSEEMISAASELKTELPECDLQFQVGDVLNLSENEELIRKFDVVFVDRLLINLNSWELQQQGISQIVACLKNDGFFIAIENFTNSYSNQNVMRQSIGLPPRTPDPYNTFIEESKFENFLVNDLKLKLVHSENFGSLHDLLLYVLIPHMNDGKISYDHPLMESVTSLLTLMPDNLRQSFGNFGQNNLYVFQR